MNFIDKNNFVVTHATEKYYDKDLEYYKKLFPNSTLIPSLERAPEFKKKELDARMLTEMLNSEKICSECILENRGFITLAQKEENEQDIQAQKDAAIQQLLTIDLNNKPDYNVLKTLCHTAGIEPVGQKKADYINAVATLQAAPPTTPESTENDSDSSDNDTNNSAVLEPEQDSISNDTPPVTEKKKEDPE